MASTTPPKHEDHKTHTTEDLLDCPTCGPKVLAKAREKLEPEITKNFKEKLKSQELVICDGCGEWVDKNAEECPECKGKTAHAVE